MANSERNKNGSATTNESKGKLNCPETNESEGQTLSPDTTTDSLDSETSKKNESPDSVVENPTQDQSGDVEQLSESLQRQANLSAEEGHKVTIFGTPEAQAIAQYLIFRIAANSEPDGVFKVEIHIPTAQAGRIIGRNGYTVKELQLYTNARIKIGDDNLPVGEETPVYITGDYLSTQVNKR